LKQLAAILLLGILIFNWCGYRLLISFRENKARAQLEAQLDDNKYDRSQLLSIRVTASHLSYYNSSQSFQRVDGQVQAGGIQYKYVARRIFNDSVEYLCIPDYAAMKLKVAGNEYSKKTSSYPGSYKVFSVECTMATDLHKLTESYTIPTKCSFRYIMPLTSSWYPDEGQPPEHRA
jgi:hypothetical protein